MPGTVRLVQLDGTLPSLPLMRLSSFHKARGDEVVFTRSPYRQMDEPEYDAVYGSAIFDYSADRVARLAVEFPGAIIGGTGSGKENDKRQVEHIVGGHRDLDYSLYPGFDASIGFSQRGCRFKCAFCVVPWKEGAPVATGSIADIWRGPGHKKWIHLLDNDVFGQPKPAWKARLRELREGDFRVCFNQGINIRVVTDEIAEELATVQYRDDGFKVRRLYTAWDNIGDEALFFRGVDRLERAGIPARHLMAYMLVGFDPDETWERIHHRFDRMVERGIRPYPMVYDRRRLDLKQFQRWAARGLYRAVPWSEYDPGAKARNKPGPGQQAFDFGGGLPTAA
ncbi:hypothetical protein [Methylobacterium brachiatum]|jgi:hypothetical protein